MDVVTYFTPTSTKPFYNLMLNLYTTRISIKSHIVSIYFIVHVNSVSMHLPTLRQYVIYNN